MRERARVFVAVLRSPVLRRIGLAFAAFSIAEWATWVAIVVYAYGRGGAAEAGLVAFIQLLPSLIIAPMASALGDRYPRRIVLTGAYAAQGAAMAAVAFVLFIGAPSPVVYVFATVTATAITLTRPLQAALLPEIVEAPDELTAANVASGTVESAGTMAGPGVASILVGLGGPVLVFAAAGAAMLASALALVPDARAALAVMRAAQAGRDPAATGAGVADGPRLAEAARAVRDEVTGGVRAIVADGGLLAMSVVGAAGWLLLGALDIFYAVLAIDVLDLGEEGVGLLGAVTGVGMLAGSVVAVGLVGARRLAPALLAAAVIAGLVIAAIGVVPVAPAVAVLLAIAGAGSIVLYVGGQTYTQRLALPAVRTRVFGVLEGAGMTMTALGALAVPAVIHLAGPTGAIVIAGLVAPMVALAAARTLARAERTITVPERELGLLRAVPMFALLSPPALERLATELRRTRLVAGTVIVAQGAPGDCYYLIDRGEAEVTIDGRVVRRLGPGEGFGEIALLRDVPRTATVTALGEIELLTLWREPFLEAITRQPVSHAAAEGVVAERLATTA